MNWMLLGGSLVAIVAMTWTARLLGLGAKPHITDQDHARRLADEAHCGFQAIDVAISKDGTAALFRDRGDCLMALLPHGNHFVSRPLRPPVSFSLDRQILKLSFGEYMLGEVTLDLGSEAGAWANTIEKIGGGDAVPDLPEPVVYAVPAFILMVLTDMLLARFQDLTRYNVKDTWTSLLLGLGSLVAGALTAGAVLAIGLWVRRFAIFDIPFSWWAWGLAFYCAHRASHRIRWMWASHVIHHSSQHYNLSTALRQSWTGFISFGFIFFMPLFLMGFPPTMLVFVGGLNTIYQFWIHTETIGRMPRWFESVMNTPSHHRVHHATNPRYLDKNYAGVFIVWDRLFNSFAPELDEERPRYGIVGNLRSFNLIWAACHEWIGIAKDAWKAPGLQNKIAYLVAPPGWSHDESRDTSEAIFARWAARNGTTASAHRDITRGSRQTL